MAFQDYALFPLQLGPERGLRHARTQGRQGRAKRARRRRPRHGPDDRSRAASSAAVGWTAPARRARARHRERTGGAAARRTSRRARPHTSPGAAGATQTRRTTDRHHLHPRHARPGGGPHDERPVRGVSWRPHRAGGTTGLRLRATGDRVRRQIRRHVRRRREAERTRRAATRDDRTLRRGGAGRSPRIRGSRHRRRVPRHDGALHGRDRQRSHRERGATQPLGGVLPSAATLAFVSILITDLYFTLAKLAGAFEAL